MTFIKPLNFVAVCAAFIFLGAMSSACYRPGPSRPGGSSARGGTGGQRCEDQHSGRLSGAGGRALLGGYSQHPVYRFSELGAVQRIDVERVHAARDEVRHLFGGDRCRYLPMLILIRVQPLEAARKACRNRRTGAAGEIADRGEAVDRHDAGDDWY